jgi:hypothetical protein
MAATPEEDSITWMAHKDTAEAAVIEPVLSAYDLAAGLTAVLTAICPNAIEKQKSFTWRKMCKPRDMTIRQYVNHLIRINEQELIYLPPFRGAAAFFSGEEFKSCVTRGAVSRNGTSERKPKGVNYWWIDLLVLVMMDVGCAVSCALQWLFHTQLAS